MKPGMNRTRLLPAGTSGNLGENPTTVRKCENHVNDEKRSPSLESSLKKLNNRFKASKNEKLRFGFVSALVTLLWAVIFAVFVYALRYFTAEEMFGTIAATKLLSMILITFAFVAIISNMITTFSTFFLSEDLELIITSPVPSSALYTARFIETLGEASWMVLVFGFPYFSRTAGSSQQGGASML